MYSPTFPGSFAFGWVYVSSYDKWAVSGSDMCHFWDKAWREKHLWFLGASFPDATAAETKHGDGIIERQKQHTGEGGVWRSSAPAGNFMWVKNKL